MSLSRQGKLKVARILYGVGYLPLFITSDAMLYKNPSKRFQYSVLAVALSIGCASLTQATDERADDRPAGTEVESGEPQRQATPAQPTVEPLDDDGDTCLV